MIGGEDVAIGRDDHAGAKPVVAVGELTAFIGDLVAEELAHERIKRIAVDALLDEAGGVDVDNAGGRFF